MVAKEEQCGVRVAAATRAKAPNFSAAPAASHPPASMNQPGSVKWCSVIMGSMPAARSCLHHPA
jgi:hypothetical protein